MSTILNRGLFVILQNINMSDTNLSVNKGSPTVAVLMSMSAVVCGGIGDIDVFVPDTIDDGRPVAAANTKDRSDVGADCNDGRCVLEAIEYAQTLYGRVPV